MSDKPFTFNGPDCPICFGPHAYNVHFETPQPEQPKREWTPSAADYKRTEQEVIKLMIASHNHERRIGGMFLLWVLTCIFSLLLLVLK